MPFARPGLTDLIARTEADLSGRLDGGDAILRRSIERVLARVLAGAMQGAYGAVDYAARQMLPDSADDEHLLRWCGVFNVERKEAVAATRTVALTGTNGSVVPVDTRMQRADGVEFRVTAEATIALGVASAAVTAVVAGVGGNAEAGDELTFVSPVAGVASLGIVQAGGTAGADQESLGALRGRLLARLREQPSGGAQKDYRRWALEVAGVTRAWVFPNRGGLGTVGVTFVMDGRENIIPLAGDLAAVAAHIAPLRPVTAAVTVFACTPLPLDLTIALTPDTAPVRAAVVAELRDLLAREAEPGGVLLLSHIREAISIAAGETDHVLTAPTANVDADPEEMIVLGDITWS